MRRTLDGGQDRGRGVVVKQWDSDSYKRRHLRWVEMMWERHSTITREEKRKEEVLGIFRSLVELSKGGAAVRDEGSGAALLGSVRAARGARRADRGRGAQARCLEQAAGAPDIGGGGR